MKTFIHALIALSLSGGAIAGGDHDHGPKHGGIVSSAAQGDFELVAKPERIVLHVSDHGKKGSTAGASGKLVILSGGEKTEAQLKPAGDDRLEAEGPFKLGAGTKIVATVNLAGKKPANLRFALK